MPAQWHGPVARRGELNQAVPEPNQVQANCWWANFHDPVLIGLVNRALISNLDLRLAEARIRQARAARGVAFAGLGPTVDANGSYRRFATGSNPARSLYDASLDASWEIDIFGGARRSVEAAEAEIQAAEEDRNNVLVTLTAEVALDYINLRSLQQRIAISNNNLAAQRHSAEITRQRYAGGQGFASGLDVANADAQVATTAAGIPLLQAAAQQTVYALSILLGREPGALLAELTPLGAIPGAPPAVPVGVPSELLRRRPDIRAAEARLHSATAVIGVAVADLYPRFLISGSGGYQAARLGSLFASDNSFWSIGPSINWSLFQSGRIRSNIAVQEAARDQSYINYQQVVLGALQEVENALVSSTAEAEHRRALVEAVGANRRAMELALQLYTAGETDFLNVLIAQRSLYGTEDALVQSTGTVSTNLVALYKALGGGWQCPP